MYVEKKVLAKMEKCYSIAPLTYCGSRHFLVATEKIGECLLFDENGRKEDVIWEGQGGVMTIVQVPETNGQFLATQKFYSPNDSKEAKIVVVTPGGDGDWKIRTLAELPFVHRFDVLRRNGVSYLLACTIKSGHDKKDDWSKPGKVYAAVLPEDLSVYDEDHPLIFRELLGNLTKNHGYCRWEDHGVETAVVSSENGVYQFVPPEREGDEWNIRCLLKAPASDSVFLDIDGDGEGELVVLSPFHGDTVSFYKQEKGAFEKIYEYPRKLEFAHAIYGGRLCGRNQVIIGHRQGERDLLLLRYDQEQKCYESQILDHGCGSANVYHYVSKNRDVVISANREIDEVAMYILTP